MERSSLPESERYIFDAGMDRGHMDRNYGEEKTRQILEGLTAENRLTIRTNLSAVTPEELVNKLKSEGVTVHAVPELPYALKYPGWIIWRD